MDDSNLTIAAAVGGALRKPEFLEELQTILDDTDVSISQLEPICQACGDCCNFTDMPHRLYASTGEIALLVSDTPPRQSLPLVCPYQQGGSCTNRKYRCLGCRTFFCNPLNKNNVTGLLQDVYENSHRKIAELHARHRICYQYREFTAACGELSNAKTNLD